MPVIFPVHPRTHRNLYSMSLGNRIDAMTGLHLLDPLGYLDFLKLMSSAKIVLTDSGGIQEEATILKVPCLTLRENTERPITVEVGSNHVVGMETEKIIDAFTQVRNNDLRELQIPPLWDGRAAERIVRILLDKV